MTHDERADAPPVAVIAAPLWRRHFDASSGVLGLPIRLNGATYTVIGVADSLGSSTFLGASVDAWVPLAQADPLLNAGWRTNVQDRWFTPFALPRGGDAEVDARLLAARDALARVQADPWRERTLHDDRRDRHGRHPADRLRRARGGARRFVGAHPACVRLQRRRRAAGTSRGQRKVLRHSPIAGCGTLCRRPPTTSRRRRPRRGRGRWRRWSLPLGSHRTSRDCPAPHAGVSAEPAAGRPRRLPCRGRRDPRRPAPVGGACALDDET